MRRLGALGRLSAAAFAAAALLATLPAPSRADTLVVPDLHIVGPVPGATIGGPFTLEVSVDLLGLPLVRLRPVMSGGSSRFDASWVDAPERTVTATDCPQTCTVQFSMDPTTFDSPLPTGTATLDIEWSTSTTSYGLPAPEEVNYVAPAGKVWVGSIVRDDTAVVSDYGRDAFDTGGLVTLNGAGPRGPEESVEVGVFPSVFSASHQTALLVGSGIWQTGPDGTPAAAIRLDTSTLADGTYELRPRARAAAGGYGWGTPRELVVRHEPAITFGESLSTLLRGWPAYVNVTVRRPLVHGSPPDRVQVSVDGGPPQRALQSPPWSTLPQDLASPLVSQVSLPTASLPVGVHTVTLQVLDSDGQPVGTAETRSVRVVEFTEQVNVPVMVVGEPATIDFRATAPPTLAYDGCGYKIVDSWGWADQGPLCTSGATSVSRSVAFTPRAAGPGQVTFDAFTGQLIPAPRSFPMTVYAQRSASLGNVSGPFGATSTAVVTVRDRRTLTGPLSAAAEVTVSLQRRPVNSSVWQTVGGGRTDAAGVARVAFSNTVNGSLRALVDSSVPGDTVVSAETAVTSVSTVAWGALAGSTRRWATVYAVASAAPYDAGAVVQVQARRLGTARWTTVGSARVPSTGRTRTGFRLGVRGTWEVRVLRAATAAHAAGPSAVRRIRVW